MRQQQVTNIAMSMLVDIYLGVFEAFPKFHEMIQENKRSSYYEEIVCRDIDFCNNMTYITADNHSSYYVKLKLQEKGVPYIEESSSIFEGKIKTNGLSVFILREADYERAVEAVKEIEKEWEATLEAKREEEQELEEERERTREDDNGDARDHQEEPEAEQEPGGQEPDEDGEEQEPGEDTEPDDTKKKGKRKNKSSGISGRSSRDSSSAAAATAAAEAAAREERAKADDSLKKAAEEKTRRAEGERKLQEERRHTQEDERHRQQEQQQARESERREQKYHDEQILQEEQQRKAEQSSYEEKQLERDRKAHEETVKKHGEFTEKSVSSDGNRYKSMDYHNHTISADGSGYEDKKREQDNTIAEIPSSSHSQQSQSQPQPQPQRQQEPSAATTAAATAAVANYDRHGSYDNSTNAGGRTPDSSSVDSGGGSYRDDESIKKDDSHYEARSQSGSMASSDAHKESVRMGGWDSAGSAAPSVSHDRQKASYSSSGVTVLGNGNDVSDSRDSGSSSSSTSVYRNTENQGEATAGQSASSFGSTRTTQESPGFGGAAAPKFIYYDNTTSNSHGTQTNSAASEQTYANATAASASDLKKAMEKATNKGANLRVSVGTLNEGRFVEQMFHAGVAPDENNVLSNTATKILKSGYANNPDVEVIFSRRDGNTQYVIRKDITAEVMKNRHINEIKEIAGSKHLKSLTASTRRLVTGSVINRGSDAGMVAQEASDVASPVGRIALQKFLHNGALQLSMDTPLSFDTVVAAYSVTSRISIDEAKQHVTAFTLGNSKTGNIGKWSLGEFERATEGENVAQFLKGGGSKRFSDMIRGMSDGQLREFIQKTFISQELKTHLLGLTRAQLNDPEIYASLLKKFAAPKDQSFLKTMRAGAMENKFGIQNFSGLIQRYLLQIFKRMARVSDAGKALMDIYSSSRYMYSAYRAGMRLMSAALGKLHVIDPNAAWLLNVVDPKKALAKTAKGAFTQTQQTQAGKAIASRFGVSARQTLKRRAWSTVKTRLLRVRSIRGLNMFRTKMIRSFGVALNKLGVTKLTGMFSKFAAQLAAKAGVALGWIAVAALVIIILLEIAQTHIKSKEEDRTGISSYVTAQDTEIVQEVITELTAKNEQFMSEINDAVNHRGNYAASTGVTANENVSFYESYTVIFRDFEGNVLEPSHVDLNNTKAIISMATRFMPYPFSKPPENAPEKVKKEYEELKQHFKDYCNFLWASTHQISIEEFHLGDDTYSEYDLSGLETSLDKGTCDKDGTTIWLQEDFTPNIIGSGSSQQQCATCQPQSTSFGTGYALCSHGKDSNPVEGWRMTGNYRDVVNCNQEHHEYCDHSDDDYDCHTCYDMDIEHVKSNHKSHWHREYEWVYECGGHMGNVVYITIGDLSRIPSFPAAGDVDYGAVAVYPGTDESAENAEGEITEEEDTDDDSTENGTPDNDQ